MTGEYSSAKCQFYDECSEDVTGEYSSAKYQFYDECSEV